VAAIKPNFLIAGTGKAGTTSLHEYLAQHPEIFMSSFKEPNFFVRDYGYNNWEDYLRLFAEVRNEKAIGESSTGYLCSAESPAWIKSTLGPVKIILMLRNPARRAESLYWWMMREGYENAPTFSKALELEPARANDPQFQANCGQFLPDYFYYSTGLYCDQVRRFIETFGRDHVRIYLFEDFAKSPRETCHDIFAFLGVDSDFAPQIAIHNEGRLPASPSFQFWLRNHAPRYLRFLPRRLRRGILDRFMRVNTRRGSAPIRDFQTEQQLLERYRDDILKLERLLDRDLSIWSNEKAADSANYVSTH